MKTPVYGKNKADHKSDHKSDRNKREILWYYDGNHKF